MKCIYTFCFLIKNRHFLMRKQKVIYLMFYFQIETFLKTRVYICVCVCVCVCVCDEIIRQILMKSIPHLV